MPETRLSFVSRMRADRSSGDRPTPVRSTNSAASCPSTGFCGQSGSTLPGRAKGLQSASPQPWPVDLPEAFLPRVGPEYVVNAETRKCPWFPSLGKRVSFGYNRSASGNLDFRSLKRFPTFLHRPRAHGEQEDGARWRAPLLCSVPRKRLPLIAPKPAVGERPETRGSVDPSAGEGVEQRLSSGDDIELL